VRKPGAAPLHAIENRRELKHVRHDFPENAMTTRLPRSVLLIGAACAAFGFAPLSAEEAPPAPAADAPKADSEVPESARLNREQANTAQAQLDANAASQRAHDDAVRQREETIRQQQADAAKAAADHEAAMARWQETVKACERGDRARCEGR